VAHSDVVNEANLNVHFTSPVIHKAGRGMPFTYDLSYDSSVYYAFTDPNTGVTSWQPVTNWGWRGITEASTGYLSYTSRTVRCPGTPISAGQFSFTYLGFVYHDPFGTPHPFTGTAVDNSDCPPPGNTVSNLQTRASDHSGYYVDFNLVNGYQRVTSADGRVVNVPSLPNSPGIVTDRNGNQLSANSNGTFTDTLGNTVLTISGTGTQASPMYYGYTGTNGFITCPVAGTVCVKVNYTNYTVHTSFGVSGVSEYPSTSVPLVSSIVLPDNSSYAFTYEKTPGTCTPLAGTFSANCVTGRIGKAILPTGGSITYVYSGGSNGIFSDGSTAGLTRTISPGGQWTYTRSGTGTQWTTTITDPAANHQVVNFSGLYETQRQVYQGAIISTNLLQTLLTCYNGNFTSCATATVTPPFTEREVFRILPNGQAAGQDTYSTRTDS
jgi:hypothetical protein